MSVRVLVTNDDGIHAPGLRHLAAALDAAGHEVVVAAPAEERSGSGTALGDLADGRQVRVESVRLDGLAVPAYAVDGPPAFAALCGAIGLFQVEPELVLVGINPGWNTGRTVLHSSTVGAAVSAASVGLPAVAVSCGPTPGARFDTAAAIAVLLLECRGSALPAGVVLNVNVPDLDLPALRGAAAVPLARRGIHGVRISRSGEFLQIRHRDLPDSGEVDGDSAAVLAGIVAVTALRPMFVQFDDTAVIAAAAALAAALAPAAV
ncbi:MAG TPA: 5'/3'-nucleotidase SurE [Sporichthyaceae bacterium]|jgi:5'-nucleotidase|nr:5'/3'-nucleotidase SurE [Sporichthyaceae bacterium]